MSDCTSHFYKADINCAKKYGTENISTFGTLQVAHRTHYYK